MPFEYKTRRDERYEEIKRVYVDCYSLFYSLLV